MLARLLAELASHQVNISNWFFQAEPEAVIGTGGIYRFKDGREVDDHIYATFEYPGGRSAVFSTIESNAFERNYEVFYGTRGTLLLQGESEAYLFEEGAATPAAARPTGIDVQPKAAGLPFPHPGRRMPGRPAGRRHGVNLGWPPIGPRSRASARPSARERRCSAAPTAPSDRRSPASPPSTPSPGRRGCRSGSGLPRSHDGDALARRRARRPQDAARLALPLRGLLQAGAAGVVIRGRAAGGVERRRLSARRDDRSHRPSGPRGLEPAGWIDLAVPIALVLVGLSLILGLFTRRGCQERRAAARALLAAIPARRRAATRHKGTYLL
jgi:hypothetical protein